ncbi:MAG: rhodanese-like domain-containing protein [Candidatus Magasanikbacteria bacterium]|nr:rhodanese-like domain-containing protein [Candidatus Magasanikbacteria bacterium]
MKKVILLFLFLILSGCGRSQNPAVSQEQAKPQKQIPEVKIIRPTFNTINAQTAKEMIESNPDLMIIDVSPNYGQGHLPGAIGYYIGDGTLGKTIPELDANNTYLIYGRRSTSSIAGAQKLANAGIKNVYRLDGDYDAWVSAGFETTN